MLQVPTKLSAMARYSLSLMILLTVITSVTPWEVSENLVFQKTNEISAIHSKWTFTFLTDIDAYGNFVNRLQLEIDYVKALITTVLEGLDNANSYYTMVSAQQLEIIEINVTFQTAKVELREIFKLGQVNRQRRAVIPLVGKSLNFLFGTLTKKDLRLIKDNIHTLTRNDEQIFHLVEESLSIINVTRIEAEENRAALNELNDIVKDVQIKLNDVKLRFDQRFDRLVNYLRLYLQFNIMINDLRDAVSRSLIYIHGFKNKISQLALGHLSPSIIAPTELKKLLLHIQAHVPRHVHLPRDPEDPWYYYQILTCATLVQDYKFLTVVNIPLLDHLSEYEVYQVHNIPIPYYNASMTARYDLESPVIAVNKKRSEYILMTDQEANQCNVAPKGFCPVTSPIYPATHSHLCIVALFQRRTKDIATNCQTIVDTNAVLPLARKIANGDWIVVANDALQFVVMCDDNLQYEVITKTPLFHLKLPMACYAISEYMTIPAYYDQESAFPVLDTEASLLRLRNYSTQSLWKPVSSLNESISIETIRQLPQMDRYPMRSMIKQLNRMRESQDPTGPGLLRMLTTSFSMISFILVTLGGVAISIYLKLKACPPKVLSCCKVMMINNEDKAIAGETTKHGAECSEEPGSSCPLQDRCHHETHADPDEPRPLMLKHGKSEV